jgi:hypothetical protein
MSAPKVNRRGRKILERNDILPYKMGALLTTFVRPDMFPSGSDVAVVRRLWNGQFYKKFKKEKFDKFTKTLFVLDQFHAAPFVPKVYRYTADLEVYLSDCGNLLRIATLPVDYVQQLTLAKCAMQAKGILIRDWGLWELNPFVLNNLCLNGGRIYFIDIGYFQRKLRAIRYVQTYGYYYLVFHFLRRIFIMCYRKFKRHAVLCLLGLVYLLYVH